MNGVTRRELVLGGLAGSAMALGLSRGSAAALAPDQTATGDLWFVDPELRPAARMIQERFAVMAEINAQNLPMLRQGTSGSAVPPQTPVSWSQRSIPGPPGAPEVSIYIVNAKPGESRPGILHTHGGGYILGSAATSIAAMQALTAQLDCAAVTVEYRLAPETTYAGSIEDNYAGLRWLHDHAEELGVDPERIAVMGESAGGGHAALLALTARDRGEVPIAFQCLVYPMLDDRTGSSRQVPDPIGRLLWTAASNRFGWRSFLGVEPGGATAPAGAVPARAENLAGLPPTWIGVGAIDLFVDEDIDYAQRLIAAGVPTELLVVPGAFHGFDGIATDTSVAKRFNAAKLAALRKFLAA